MGSFDYTCTVSGLPIHSGDAVRYLLLTQNPYNDSLKCGAIDWFFPRTFPLKGNYNSYGAVEDIEDELGKSLWLETLKLDLVSRGWGDNACHDVPTSPDMTFEALLEAIGEHRVHVQRSVGMESSKERRKAYKYKIPLGVPTMKRVTKRLMAAGLPMYMGEFGTETYMVDNKGYGTIRVRFAGTAAETTQSALEAAQAVLGDFATVIRAGTGSYADRANLYVYAKPGVQISDRPEKKEPLQVHHAMIREDVWQELLKMPYTHWSHDAPKKIEDFRAQGMALYEKAQECIKMNKKVVPLLEAEGKAQGKDNIRDMGGLFLETALMRMPLLGPLLGQELIPFTVGLATNFRLMCEKELPLKEAQSFVNDASEMAYVFCILSGLRYWWRPSCSAGPQWGPTDPHLKFHQAMGKVATRMVKQEKEDVSL